jgi:Cys-tRNA(Pro) deacylase
MSKNNFPVTPAIRFLNENEIRYTPHQYEYSEKGGTKQTAIELNVDEHSVIKTLIFSDGKNIFIVLMHGDMEVSTKELARMLEVKTISPADSNVASKTTGYIFGGMSPFGTKNNLPIFIQESIMALENIFINGGKRGFILGITREQFLKIIEIMKKNTTISLVDVAINK